MPVVVNIKRGQAYTVYIGRAGHGLDGYFGNPVRRGHQCPVCGAVHHDRLATIDCFELYARRRLVEDATYCRKVRALRGERLGCFCAPQACHGDVLVKLCCELHGIAVPREEQESPLGLSILEELDE